MLVTNFLPELNELFIYIITTSIHWSARSVLVNDSSANLIYSHSKFTTHCILISSHRVNATPHRLCCNDYYECYIPPILNRYWIPGNLTQSGPPTSTFLQYYSNIWQHFQPTVSLINIYQRRPWALHESFQIVFLGSKQT